MPAGIRLAALAIVLAVQVSGQRHSFRFYGANEGLRNLAIQVLLQDQEGYIWAGTQNGLFRYDGHLFHEISFRRGLPSNYIDSLAQTKDGTLWIGTQSGLFRMLGNQIVQVPGWEGVRVTALGATRAGEVFIGSQRGLSLGHLSSDGSWRFQWVAEGHVSGIYLDGGDTVWYGQGQSLCSLRGGTSQCTNVPGDTSWEGFLLDRKGNFWLLSRTMLLIRRAGKKAFENVAADLPLGNWGKPRIVEDSAGRIYVSTTHGLATRDGERWRLIGAREGLDRTELPAIMEDREQSLWLGTLGQGVARWLGRGVTESFTLHNGFPSSTVWQIAPGADDTLWVGTHDGLVHGTRDGRRWRWTLHPKAGGKPVRTVRMDPQGWLWVSQTPGGLILLHPATGRVKPVTSPAALTQGRLHGVHFDPDGTVWLASASGLFRRAPHSENIERVRLPQEPDGTGFYQVRLDTNGNHWATSTAGLFFQKNGDWKRLTQSDGLRADWTMSLAVKDYEVWVGYRPARGITRIVFSQGSPQFTHFTEGDVLRSDVAYFLVFGRDGRLWSGSDRGLQIFDGKQWSFFSSADGLVWDDCDTEAYLDARDSFWVGTSIGLANLRPDSHATRKRTYPIVFSSVRFRGEAFPVDTPIKVPADWNHLDVRYSALTFLDNADLR
ncbi:MAG: hypothetical protein JNK48_23815, partial [Bryobacterales bacterium]|nr:hypothetical protein [Bryobacterales bacterium]